MIKKITAKSQRALRVGDLWNRHSRSKKTYTALQIKKSFWITKANKISIYIPVYIPQRTFTRIMSLNCEEQTQQVLAFIEKEPEA